MASSWMENPTDKDRLLLTHTNGDRRFQCEDNNVALTNVQPHYYRVRQVELCHHLGWSSQALILSTLALGAMPKQQQQKQQQQPQLATTCAQSTLKESLSKQVDIGRQENSL